MLSKMRVRAGSAPDSNLKALSSPQANAPTSVRTATMLVPNQARLSITCSATTGEQRSGAGPGPPPEPPPSQRSLPQASGAKAAQQPASWAEGSSSPRPSSGSAPGSRRKPASPGRTLRNGRGGEAEPLDLSLRAGPGGEAGPGGALHRCLFCPFATGAPELMALHLQVHHSRRARGRRPPQADASLPYLRAPTGETPPSPPLQEGEEGPRLSRSGEVGLGGQER